MARLLAAAASVALLFALAPRTSGQSGGVLEGFDPLSARLRGETYVASLLRGREARLTLRPTVQQAVEREMARYDLPEGAVAVLAPSTGEVLAYASYRADGRREDLVRQVRAPAASTFKVVTGAALLGAGVAPDTRVCYGGGASGLVRRDLEDDPARDTRCATLSRAMGRSINAIFAKLSDRHLERADLARYAAAFGYGQRIPFDVAVERSRVEVPTGRLERARMAAGFWHTFLSPLHGALVAATVANDGVMMRPRIVREVRGARGAAGIVRGPETHRRVLPRARARALGRMMEETVSRGTARRSFFDAEGNAFLPGVRVAGKTGTLSEESPYRGYTWFIGYAPADAPRVAVAALVVNTPRWRIKAPHLAMVALRAALRDTAGD